MTKQALIDLADLDDLVEMVDLADLADQANLADLADLISKGSISFPVLPDFWMFVFFCPFIM